MRGRSRYASRTRLLIRRDCASERRRNSRRGSQLSLGFSSCGIIKSTIIIIKRRTDRSITTISCILVTIVLYRPISTITHITLSWHILVTQCICNTVLQEIPRYRSPLFRLANLSNRLRFFIWWGTRKIIKNNACRSGWSGRQYQTYNSTD